MRATNPTPTPTKLRPIRQPRGPGSSGAGGFATCKAPLTNARPDTRDAPPSGLRASFIGKTVRGSSSTPTPPSPPLPPTPPPPPPVAPHRYPPPPTGPATVPVETWIGAMLDALLSSKSAQGAPES